MINESMDHSRKWKLLFSYLIESGNQEKSIYKKNDLICLYFYQGSLYIPKCHSSS